MDQAVRKEAESSKNSKDQESKNKMAQHKHEAKRTTPKDCQKHSCHHCGKENVVHTPEKCWDNPPNKNKKPKWVNSTTKNAAKKQWQQQKDHSLPSILTCCALLSWKVKTRGRQNQEKEGEV